MAFDIFWVVCKWISKRREEKMYSKLSFQKFERMRLTSFFRDIAVIFFFGIITHRGVHVCMCVFHCIQLFCDPVDSSRPGAAVDGILQARILGVRFHFFLQGIFPTQGSSAHLLHWQSDSLPLSHQGSLMCGGDSFYYFLTAVCLIYNVVFLL